MNPFTKKDPISQTFFQKLFGILPKENSIVELHNLLAQKGVGRVSLDDIALISSKYRLPLYKKYYEELLDIFKTYLEFCLRDKQLSEEEIRSLDHLKFIFNLKDKDTKDIYDKAVQDVYKLEVEEALKDGLLSEDEERFLVELEQHLQIPHDLAMSIYGEKAQDLLHKLLEETLSDQKLSPDEEKQLQTLSANLHLKLSYDTGTQELLDKFKLFWQIDNGILPDLSQEINIHLQKNEICHFHIADVRLLEFRTVTKSIGSYGDSSYDVFKGVSWRAGEISLYHISEDILKMIDTGKLYLTSKRIIFMGGKGNATITLNRILDFKAYSNGIDIQKDGGKNPFFQFDTLTDVFAMLLEKLLRQQ